MVKPPSTLIVGAGQAGLQIAASLRELGATGPITLVGGEPHPPYQRPPLSKAYLQGKMAADELALQGPDFYRDHRIDVIAGEWVEAIELTDAETGAGRATTRAGKVLAFDRLALTLGGTPRRMAVPGGDLAGIHYLRTMADADALRADLAGAENLVVVGGGFVGLEIAASATAMGQHVTVLEVADRLMARVVAPVMSEFYATAHRRRGTRVLLGAGVTGFTGRAGRVCQVDRSDGDPLPADVVVVGIGLLPNVGLAESLGLACDGGLVIDPRARTSLPSVVAAGDCTIMTHPERGPLRLESVQNAIAQGKTAAATLAGVEPPPPTVPWFWSDQADLKLQMAGLNHGYDQVVVRGEPASEQFSALYYRAGALVSIEAVNAPRDYMAVRRLLETGRALPAEAAGDPSQSLKDFWRA